MKLRMICENIRKTEFYDFYALTYVYQELKTSTGVDPEYKREITDTLRDLAGYIFDDLMNQLCRTIAGRILDLGHLSDYYKTKNKSLLKNGNLAVCPKYGIHLVMQDAPESHDLYDPKRVAYWKQWPYRNPNEIIALTIPQKGKFIHDLLQFRDGHATSFTTVGGVWEKLAASFVQLTKTNTNNLDAVVLSIDRIYGLTHHNGRILDHLDERSWLGQALNTRTLTSPKNLLFHASPHIRELLTSADIGIPRHEQVGILQEIDVLLTRWNKKGLFGSTYTIIDDHTFEFTLTMRKAVENQLYPGHSTVFYSWNNFNYNKWSNYDYSQDQEGIVQVIGELKNNTITIYDINHHKIGAILLNSDLRPPKARIDGELVFVPKDLMTAANNIIEIATGLVSQIKWHPIQGDPNPPRGT